MTKQEDDIQQCCIQVVNSMFETFQDETMQGSKFSWNIFPDIMRRHCSVMVPLYLGLTCATEEQQTFIGNLSEEYAQTLILRNNYNEPTKRKV